MPNRFLLAFDKFKDSMTAQEATRRAKAAIQKKYPAAHIHEAPLTDGGEGFCEILTTTAGGKLETHSNCGPSFEQLDSLLGFVEAGKLPEAALAQLNLPEGINRIAVIEMAQAAGIQSVPVDVRDARHTTTFGVGQQIQQALEGGAEALLLGVGGSATSDCGLGALEALGFQFFDTSGAAITELKPAKFSKIARIEKPAKAIDFPPIRIACDVNNPLLGERGAAHVFGPQKGLKAEEIPAFDTEIGRIAGLLCGACECSTEALEIPGAGAAGGIAAGLVVACDAELVPGFNLVRAWLDLEKALAEADFLLTGEGRWDRSSLDGKGPYAVIEAVAEREVNVLLVAGALEAEAVEPVKAKLTGSIDTIELKVDGKTLKENLAAGPERLSELLGTYFT